MHILYIMTCYYSITSRDTQRKKCVFAQVWLRSFCFESNEMKDDKNVHIIQIPCEQISVAKEDNLRVTP